MSTDKIDIVFEDEYCVVINKPSNMPSAPLIASEKNTALNFVASVFPGVMEIRGKKLIEGGLLHRLDTDTNGLLLFAKKQCFYDGIIEVQKNNLFIKEYTAECEIIKNYAQIMQGFPPEPISLTNLLNKKTYSFSVTSFFRAYGPNRKVVRPVNDKSSVMSKKKCKNDRKYTTEILLNSINNNTVIAKCSLYTGFRHQVRCHLAWCGLPIIGDKLYNPNYMSNKVDNLKTNLRFTATKLSFFHPIIKKTIVVEL
ncbi:MAG: hypothetical protein J6B81_02005 [Spirochaetaceae bacterium]|nr:hypothetical protein [Spirochaetaceae bacterium]